MNLFVLLAVTLTVAAFPGPSLERKHKESPNMVHQRSPTKVGLPHADRYEDFIADEVDGQFADQLEMGPNMKERKRRSPYEYDEQDYPPDYFDFDKDDGEDVECPRPDEVIDLGTVPPELEGPGSVHDMRNLQWRGY
ncbi:hypothetical protein V3C99_009311 [Haemonchus contortus]